MQADGEHENALNFFFDILGGASGAISTPDYWLGILTSVALLFIRHRIKLPKIRVTGRGGGSSTLDNGDKFGLAYLTIANVPSFLGYPVNRETLVVTSARIFDPATRKFEGHLMRWKGAPEERPFNIEIKAGESAALFVFGSHNGRAHHYVGKTINNVELSDTLIEIGSSRKLEIHILDNLQRRYTLKFRISAEEKRNQSDGTRVQIRTKVTLADRWRNFGYGFNEMIRAITGPSY